MKSFPSFLLHLLKFHIFITSVARLHSICYTVYGSHCLFLITASDFSFFCRKFFLYKKKSFAAKQMMATKMKTTTTTTTTTEAVIHWNRETIKLINPENSGETLLPRKLIEFMPTCKKSYSLFETLRLPKPCIFWFLFVLSLFSSALDHSATAPPPRKR